MLTLGSLFNGISGWILSAEKYGIKTLWESEIDDYCEAVTHYHYHDVKQLGDITKINGAEIEPVDIICSGSPCQSFSIAGKHTGLDGVSGIFYEFVRIVKEMQDATNGVYPKFVVWENVPGAFSSNKGEMKVRKNPPSVVIDDVAKIPTEFQKQKIDVTIDKVALKKAIQGGEKVDGAHIEQGEKLVY